MRGVRTSLLAAAVSLAVLAAPAPRAQIGNPAPDFIARRWINSPPLELAELRGKVVLIEVFRTWSEESIADVGGLSARCDKHAANGLVVIAVSDEEPEVVAHWVRKYEPSYPVVALKGAEFDRALGARDYFPIQAVIDAEGTLVHSTALAPGGFESPLANALGRAKAEPLWPKKLAGALERIREEQLAAAWIEVSDVLASAQSAPVQPVAEKLRAQVEALALELEADARKLFAAGRLFEAKRSASTLIAKPGKPALPNAEACAKLLAEIAASPDSDAELRAGPAFVAAYELELERDFGAAFEKYRAFAKQNGRLKIGSAAQARIDDFRARGVVGYSKACPDCALHSKACAAHAEKARNK